MKYNKIALIFPGQGSQFPGMVKDLFYQEKFKKVRDVVRGVYQHAEKILEYDVAKVSHQEPKFKVKAWVGRWSHIGNKNKEIEIDMDQTKYTQPLVFVADYAIYKALEQRCSDEKIDFHFDFLAGHSFGQYVALVVSGAIDYEPALKLVQKRAEFMSDVCKQYPNNRLMALVRKKGELSYEEVKGYCDDTVEIALINSNKQIVVGGDKGNLGRLSKKTGKGIHSKILAVEGSPHTRFMKPAADKLKPYIDGASIEIGSKPIESNVRARAIIDPDDIRDELCWHIFKTANWRGEAEKMISRGTNVFVELGSKRILTRLIQDIDPTVMCLNVEDTKSLEDTVEVLKEVYKG